MGSKWRILPRIVSQTGPRHSASVIWLHGSGNIQIIFIIQSHKEFFLFQKLSHDNQHLNLQTSFFVVIRILLFSKKDEQDEGFVLKYGLKCVEEFYKTI